jgi:hypothetical protein
MDCEAFVARPVKVLEGGREARPLVGSGMISVLADGPAEYHTQAALVMSRNGIEVSRGGEDPDSNWVLTFENGDRQTVEPHHWIEPDSDYNPWGESSPTLDAALCPFLRLI